MPPCSLCSSTDHVFCGFCARCKEHAEFVRSCVLCGEFAIAGETCRLSITGHTPDETTEALSICCGASGNAYDHDPT